ncbi:kinase-like domain-containing protein [Chaetomium strumarium]|uniref:Kinase-like domain-containing protein n=1 Tax=Chaetomium strumarium TaxID=1170767 RepID=A0AAJ0M2Y0_9PEZI|nr:kinase-like domain-containing protein [Chaetomium strumarium]
MSQSPSRILLEDLPEDEPWPPVPPDVDFSAIQVETPELSVTINSMLYKIKGQPSVLYKMRAEYREYQLHVAAGDCAIPVRGKVLGKPTRGNGELFFYGFIMDLTVPVPDTLSLPQRREITQQMIQTVQKLHAKRIIHGDMKLENMLLDNQGKLRLCDFAEGRYVEEDGDVWDGNSTLRFESPNRLLRAQQFGRDPPPPIMEDDLYGLGLSIWQLYTGRIPHEDIAGDDVDLKERQRQEETVNVAKVDDQEARDIITSLLCKGGARI